MQRTWISIRLNIVFDKLEKLLKKNKDTEDSFHFDTHCSKFSLYFYDALSRSLSVFRSLSLDKLHS